MKILLLGGNGQLGTDLRAALAAHVVVATGRSPEPGGGLRGLDVADPAAISALIAEVKPALVLNTTAFHRVDDIERDARQALLINALAAQQLALACRAADCALLHVSTDYVFDGATRAPYTEIDAPNPLSAYGASKLSGELLIRAAWPKHYIVRTCGLYGRAGASGKGGNFVNTMLRLAREGKPIRVVGDQICAPTATVDLAAQIALLIETGEYGTYHITSAGQCAWNVFAEEIFRLAAARGLIAAAPPVAAISSAEFGAPARRPAYSVLENRALADLGLDRMRAWQAALAGYIASL